MAGFNTLRTTCPPSFIQFTRNNLLPARGLSIFSIRVMSTGVKRSITDFFAVSKRQKSTASSGKVALSHTAAATTHSTSAKPSLNALVHPTAFNKQKWVDSLSQEQKQLLNLEINTMDESWLAVLHDEMTKPYFLDLKKFLQREWQTQTIFPPQNEIYSWTRLAPLSKVHVLVVGQDPYHNYNQAHGLAFSVKDPQTRPPPSLLNIYKCLKIDYPQFEIPKQGDLTKWAEQGVLLLNTCLTVRAHNANSHAKHGWEKFTSAAIKKLIDYKNNVANQGLVVIAWGSPAQRTVRDVGRIDWDKNLFLKSVHPSPLSASRGFFQSQHFIKCNDWLKERYGQGIDWALVDGNTILEAEKKPEESKENEEPKEPKEPKESKEPAEPKE